MVNKIFEYLKSQTGEYNEVEVYVSTAEGILNIIEEAGMRAPEPGGDLAGILDDGDWEKEITPSGAW